MSAGLFQSDVPDILRQVTDLVYSFAFLWTVYVYILSGGSIFDVARIATCLIFFFCLVVLSSGLLGFPNWQSPFLGGHFTLADTGFGGMRTGWSIGISLFLPFALMTAASFGRRRRFFFGNTNARCNLNTGRFSDSSRRTYRSGGVSRDHRLLVCFG